MATVGPWESSREHVGAVEELWRARRGCGRKLEPQVAWVGAGGTRAGQGHREEQEQAQVAWVEAAGRKIEKQGKGEKEREP